MKLLKDLSQSEQAEYEHLLDEFTKAQKVWQVYYRLNVELPVEGAVPWTELNVARNLLDQYERQHGMIQSDKNIGDYKFWSYLRNPSKLAAEVKL